jgi:hypothetical protein
VIPSGRITGFVMTSLEIGHPKLSKGGASSIFISSGGASGAAGSAGGSVVDVKRYVSDRLGVNQSKS